MPLVAIGRPRAVKLCRRSTPAQRDMIIIGISASGGVNQPALQQLTAIDIAGLYEYDDYHVIGTNGAATAATAGGYGYDQHA